jgi:dipeptidyl aminopeptidase/acylaminoacyl peptidase
VTPDIVRRQATLEAHDLAPDGSFAVVVRRTVERGRYLAHLWLVPIGRGRPRRLTSGRVVEGHPRISPDGSRVAFTRSDADDDEATSRVHVLELATPAGRKSPGAPRARSPRGAAVGELAWSPDGTRIAYTAEVDPPRFIVGEVKPGASPLARHIRRMDWRWDEAGHVDRWSQLHVVDAAGPVRARQLTHADGGAADITWRPDGRAIAYVADPRPDGDRQPRTSVWEVVTDGEGGTGDGGPGDGDGNGSPAPRPREILALRGPVSAPAYSPDGRWIAAVGVNAKGWTDEVSPSLFLGSVEEPGPVVGLGKDLDRPVGSWVDCDLMGWSVKGRGGPVWETDDAIVAIVSDRGRAHPWRFPVDPATGTAAGAPERLAAGDTAARSLAVGGGVISVLSTVGNGPMELCTVEPARGEGPGTLRRRTTMGSAWTRGLPWPEMRVVEAPGPGGPIETWIASPAGAGDAPLPTIVDVHGGPLGAWAPTPSLEVVLLCAAGYRVVLPNIRGSATYGADWIRPQLGHWGEVDAEDVHAALDHVIALGLADPKRLGVLGLSYGGFMVNWLVGTTDRFRAAVSENGVANQVSAWAHSDCGPEYCRTALMGDPTTPDGVRKLWRQSPLRNVAEVRTPLLMLQAEADRRCPPADTEQLFIALRWLGREVEYVLYPDEFHVYATTGRPDRRIDRHRRMLAWFDRWVKG